MDSCQSTLTLAGKLSVILNYTWISLIREEKHLVVSVFAFLTYFWLRTEHIITPSAADFHQGDANVLFLHRIVKDDENMFCISTENENVSGYHKIGNWRQHQNQDPIFWIPWSVLHGISKVSSITSFWNMEEPSM